MLDKQSHHHKCGGHGEYPRKRKHYNYQMDNLITLLTNPYVTTAGIFCAVIVPVVNVVAGKKYARPLVAVGFTGFVIAIIMNWN